MLNNHFFYIGFAIALANLYHLDQIIIPDRLIVGTLAASHFLDIDRLKSAACDKLSHYINKKNVSEFYKIALRVCLFDNQIFS